MLPNALLTRIKKTESSLPSALADGNKLGHFALGNKLDRFALANTYTERKPNLHCRQL